VSRAAAAPHVPGLAALRAVVAEARHTDLVCAARAHRPAGPDDVRLRAVLPARRGPGASLGQRVVPAPAQPGDDAEPPSPCAGEGLRLVQRAQAGDAEAFGELYDRYVDVVFRYVAYRVASRQLAEDLTSETFLRALRRIGSFTWQGRDVGAWFVTIARNLIADHYKSSRYRLELTTEDMTTVSDGGAARLVADSPEGEVLEQMQNRVLLEAVRRLNAEQQECIALRFLQGLSVAETAAVMGKNEGAIKALQYRAVRSLGRLLPEGVEL
jgi:RNA polymerase sigma-70 factor (ECF subfamily)